MNRPRLILASSSSIRRELLARLRLPFETALPRFDEVVHPPGPVSQETARALALENARGKALSLRADFPDALILGSDQVCECEGTLLGKPGTEERAFTQLRFLAGKEHHLHTGVVLLSAADGRMDAEVVTSTLCIRALGDKELRRYVRLERPVDSAGSYLTEGLGIALFEYLRGTDPTAIMGLPLVTVSRLLAGFGCSPLSAAEPESEHGGGRDEVRG